MFNDNDDDYDDEGNYSDNGYTGDTRLAGDRLVLNIAGVDYPFRWCPAGTFMMGSPESEKHQYDDERQHHVILSQGYWMLETQVTQAMWESIMGKVPSHFKGDKLPVENVSWLECQEYISKLNDLNVAPNGYRFSLPTEAQWEYACRAGTTTPYHFGNMLRRNQVNFDLNEERTTKVGSYSANVWNLYDMHGNVWEWCSDWYGNYINDSVTNPNYIVVDPTGPSTGLYRVLRGGGWGSNVKLCRSADRNRSVPTARYISVGLRISLVCVEQGWVGDNDLPMIPTVKNVF